MNNGHAQAHVLNVCEAAIFFNTTEKAIRRRVDRGLVPFRRLGMRIIFLRSELETFVGGLPGVTLAEVQQNRQARHG